MIRINLLLSAILFAGFLYSADYLWFAVVTVAFSFFWNASLPQFEAATLFHLKAESHRYSRIRLWGSVGFIAAVLGIGRFLDDFSIAYLPYIIIGLLILNWLVAVDNPGCARPESSESGRSVDDSWAKREVLRFFSGLHAAADSAWALLCVLFGVS